MPAENGRSDRSDERPRLADRRGVESVYQPAEDSNLLADVAVDTIDTGDRVLDVGTGSGYVADRIADETGANVVGVDVNPDACRQTRRAGIPAVRGDLVAPFRADRFDVVCCNPPYLPTAPSAEWDDPMEAALSGGPTGRRVIERLLATVPRVLAADGVVLLLVSTLADLDAVRGEAAEQGLDSTVLAEAMYPFERLVVLEIVPSGRG